MDHKSDLNYKCALLTLVVMLIAITESASGQTTAFIYQGRLMGADNPAERLYRGCVSPYSASRTEYLFSAYIALPTAH